MLRGIHFPTTVTIIRRPLFSPIVLPLTASSDAPNPKMFLQCNSLAFPSASLLPLSPHLSSWVTFPHLYHTSVQSCVAVQASRCATGKPKCKDALNTQTLGGWLHIHRTRDWGWRERFTRLCISVVLSGLSALLIRPTQDR